MESKGLSLEAFDMRVKNLANTNVMHWAGRLFALWEGGKPTESRAHVNGKDAVERYHGQHRYNIYSMHISECI